jgi:hypothetical protein
VDPKILPEQPGLAREAHIGEEGSSYLRKLKSQTRDTTSGAAPFASVGSAASVKPVIDWKERRRSPRYRCSGSAEFRVTGSDIHTWGTLADISLHGCYVEMNEAHPVGAKVDLVLKSCGVRVHINGTVRVSYPSLGMGICFDDPPVEGKRELEQLIAVLSGQTTFSTGVKDPVVSLADTLRRTDPQALRDELLEFFSKNSLLARDEFHQIAKRARRA